MEEKPTDPQQNDGDRLIGETVDGRFRLEEKLGEGAVGRVYRANQLSIERSVALKMLHGDFRRDDEYQKRFLREAKVISGFNHPNIVRLIDYGEDQARSFSYLVMEFVEGIELGELVSRGRFEPEFALEIAHQIAGGLFAAHQQDIIHRDLKAENIILVPVPGGTFQAKILDFGVALPRNTSTRLTSSGDVFGTPAYMSPEQAEGDRELGQTADLYSLGVLLFEMLTGELPFQQSSSLKMMVAHIEKDPPRLSEATEGAYPDPLDQLVLNLLAKSPDDRPHSGDVLRDRIEAVREQQGWSSIDLDTEQLATETFQPWIDGTEAPARESSVPADESRDNDMSVEDTLGSESSILNQGESESSASSDDATATGADNSSPEIDEIETDSDDQFRASAPTDESTSEAPAPSTSSTGGTHVEWGGNQMDSSVKRIGLVVLIGVGVLVGGLVLLVGGGAATWMVSGAGSAETDEITVEKPSRTPTSTEEDESVRPGVAAGRDTGVTDAGDDRIDTADGATSEDTGASAEQDESMEDTSTSIDRTATADDESRPGSTGTESEAGARPSSEDKPDDRTGRRAPDRGARAERDSPSESTDETTAESESEAETESELPNPSSLDSNDDSTPDDEAQPSKASDDDRSASTENSEVSDERTDDSPSAETSESDGDSLDDKIEQQEQESWQWE